MSSRTRLVAVAGGLVLLLGLAFAPGAPQPEQHWNAVATTHSPGPGGVRALYLLFGRVGFKAARLLQPTYDTLPSSSTLWLLAREPLQPVEVDKLVQFVRGGGRLVLVPRRARQLLKQAGLGQGTVERLWPARGEVLQSRWTQTLSSQRVVMLAGLPEPVEVYAQLGQRQVVAAWAVGAGRVISLGAEDLALNGSVGAAQNGPFLVRLGDALSAQGGGTGVHTFDEFKTGFGDTSLWTLLRRVPYRFAVAQLALIGLLLLMAMTPRRRPADPPAPASRRATQEHLDAVAGLWSRAGDAGLPLGALIRALAERARLRSPGSAGRAADPALAGGAPPTASPAAIDPALTPFLDWIGRVRPALLPRAETALDRAAGLARTRRPSAEEARRAAAELMTIEKEALEC